MTIDSAFLEALSSTHAHDVRRALRAAGGGEGVVAPGDLKVSAGSGLSVDVAAGVCLIADDGTLDGVQLFSSTATENVAVTAGDASNARNDLICARALDTAESDASDGKGLVVLAGTPAASPVDPAVPDRHYPLARMVMPAGGGSASVATFTDLRALVPAEARGRGQVAVSGSGARTTSSTSPVEVTGSAVTVTTEEGRTYQIAASGLVRSNAEPSGVALWIERDGSPLRLMYTPVGIKNNNYTVAAVISDAPAAGSHTYRLTVESSSASATVKADTAPLIVNDVAGDVV